MLGFVIMARAATFQYKQRLISEKVGNRSAFIYAFLALALSARVGRLGMAKGETPFNEMYHHFTCL